MKINLSDEIKDLNGESIKVQGKTIGTKTIVLNCLGVMDVLNGVQATKVWDLCLRMNKTSGNFSMNEEDVALVRGALDQNKPKYTPMIIGQVLTNLQ